MEINSNAQQNRNVYQKAVTANCVGSSILKTIAIIHQQTVYPTAKQK